MLTTENQKKHDAAIIYSFDTNSFGELVKKTCNEDPFVLICKTSLMFMRQKNSTIVIPTAFLTQLSCHFICFPEEPLSRVVVAMKQMSHIARYLVFIVDTDLMSTIVTAVVRYVCSLSLSVKSLICCFNSKLNIVFNFIQVNL